MSEQSIKIIVFTTAFRPLIGGSELALENIARRLPEIDFEIITPRLAAGSARLAVDGNIRIQRLGWGWKGDKYYFPLLGFFKARSLIKQHQIKIIHAFQASQSAGAAWLLKLFFPKLRFILTLQEGKPLERQNIFVKSLRHLIIKRADVIVAISQYLADYAAKVNKKIKSVVIPNGVDLQWYSVRTSQNAIMAIKEKYAIKGNNRVIITVSRLVPKNAIKDLISALSIVKKAMPEIRLLIIGDGPEKLALQKLIDNYELKNEAVMLGEIANQAIPVYLAAADLFVRPSLSEGLGTAFLEAMAAGLPIIGTPVGGIPDFLREGATGLFCRPHDPEDLAQKIITIFTDIELYRSLVTNGRKLIEEKYDWQSIADQYKKLYGNS